MDSGVITILLSISMDLSMLFLYCYFGEMASDSHLDMSDCVYNMSWYRLDTWLQKYFHLMIVNMQIPLHYHGFKIINLDLNTFIRVSVINYRI